MGEENKRLLDEELKAIITQLSSLDPTNQEYAVVVENYTKLYKLKLEEDKIANEHLENIEKMEVDEDYKAAQLAETVKDRKTKFVISAAEVVLPIVFYSVWMVLGFKFEEHGSLTSQVFKGLHSRFRPTK